MTRHAFFLFILVTSLVLGGCAKDEDPFNTPGTTSTDSVSFIGQVIPIFNSYCIQCHNESHPKLNLKSSVAYSQLLETGFSAPYVDTLVPGNSNIYLHLTAQLPVMPPSGPLPSQEVSTIFQWIQEGAKLW